MEVYCLKRTVSLCERFGINFVILRMGSQMTQVRNYSQLYPRRLHLLSNMNIWVWHFLRLKKDTLKETHQSRLCPKVTFITLKTIQLNTFIYLSTQQMLPLH